jgi:hypothetical protein
MKLIVSHVHDLPTFWDGRKVEWEGWTTHQTTARFHLPPEVCVACGLSAEHSINLGRVHPLPEETYVVSLYKRLPSGRTYDKGRELSAWPVVFLVAFRCQHCEHDTVWDKRTDEWWDLDPSDYGEGGSPDPRLL